MTIQEFISQVQSFLQQITVDQWLLWGGGCLLSYLIGSISFAYFVARANGVDLRAEGSGNLGATNVYRTLGPKAGIKVFILDVLKGFVPAMGAFFLRGPDPGALQGLLGFLNPVFDTLRNVAVAAEPGTTWHNLAIAYSVAAIAGHMFPFYLGFKGGKAVSTGCGAFLVLAPAPTLAAVLLWAVVLVVTRYVSVASLTAAGFLAAQIWFGTLNVKKKDSLQSTLWFALFVFIIVLYRHRGNVARLLKGTESRLAKPERKRKARKSGTGSRARRGGASRAGKDADNPARRAPEQEGYPGRRLPK